MRQGGMCAAACLYALDNNVERLAEDHAHARALARGLAQLPGLRVEAPETNLVFFDTAEAGMTAAEFAAAAAPARHPGLGLRAATAPAPACTSTYRRRRWRRRSGRRGKFLG